jgi:CRP-like cAMP-binding protein
MDGILGSDARRGFMRRHALRSFPRANQRDSSESQVSVEIHAELDVGAIGITVAQFSNDGLSGVRHFIPASIALLQEWLAELDALASKSPALALRLAAQQKTIANRLKNAQGALTGLKRASFVDKRRAEERRLAELAKRPEHVAHAGALTALATLAKAQTERSARDFVLGHLRIQIAVLFGEVNGTFSDAAYKISKRAKPVLFRDDWKSIFDLDDIREQVRDITTG